MTARLIRLLLAFMLPCGGALAQDSTDDWQQIPEADAIISLRVPGLDGGVARFYKGRTQHRHHLQQLGSWTGPSGRYPSAAAVVTKLAPGYLFRWEGSLEDWTKDLSILEGESATFGEVETRPNTLGQIRYMAFGSATVACVSFLQYMGQAMGDQSSIGTVRVHGYYCVGAEQGLSAEEMHAVVGGISVKAKALR